MKRIIHTLKKGVNLIQPSPNHPWSIRKPKGMSKEHKEKKYRETR